MITIADLKPGKLLQRVVEAAADFLRAPPVTLRPYVQQSRKARLLSPLLLLALLLVCFGYGVLFVLFPLQIALFMSMPIALVALIIIWALPHHPNPPLKAMRQTFFIVLAVLALWPNYLAIALPGLPWITLLRLFGFPMFFFFLMSLSVSSKFRFEIIDLTRAVPAIWRMLIVFVLLQVVTIALSNRPLASLQLVVIFQIYCTSIFLISAYIFKEPGRATFWTILFCAFALPLSIIGFQERRLGHLLWLGHVPSFLAVADETVAKIMTPHARSASGIYRVQGPFVTALEFAEYLALTTPFFIYHMLNAPRMIFRVLSFCMLPIIFLTIRLTDARLGVVGFSLSALIYLFFWGATRWHNNRSSILGPAITLSFPVFASLFFAATFAIRRLHIMFWGDGSQNASNEARQLQWELGIPKILTHPLGYGPGRGGANLGYVNPAGVGSVDSYVLMLALDYGILGAILFMGLFVVGGYRAALGAINARGEERLLAPLAITMVVFFVIKLVLAQQSNHPLLFMMLGMIVALVHRRQKATAV